MLRTTESFLGVSLPLLSEIPVPAVHLYRRCAACFAEARPRRRFAPLLLSLTLVAVGSAAQEIQADAKMKPLAAATSGPAPSSISSLTCLVRNMLGRPLSGISVEVRNLQTHSAITSALSRPDGAVVFHGLAPGRYEITVAGGVLPPRRELQVDGGSGQAVLELPLSQFGGHETVSVGELKVPRQAKEALNAASDAMRRQDWRKARTQAMRAVTLQPGYAAALAMLGYLDLQEGNLETASASAREAIQSDPNLAFAYLTLGTAYNSMKRYEAALQALSVFPSVSADIWQLHYELARSYMGLRKFELGLNEINSSQRLAGKDPAVLHLGRAHALAGLHRNSEAVAEVETVLQKQPHGPYASDAQNLLATLRSQSH